jgi:hypothetical protein
MNKSIFWSCLILLCACNGRTGDRNESVEAPLPPAITSVSGLPLDSALALLDVELKAALESKLDDTGFERFQRAEALTDRLLETRYPFQWLKGPSYSVDSKLRQIQALADRILAKHRSGMPADSAVPDLERVRHEVVWLRTELRNGGGAAPPAIEKLLSGQDTGQAMAPAGAPPAQPPTIPPTDVH